MPYNTLPLVDQTKRCRPRSKDSAPLLWLRRMLLPRDPTRLPQNNAFKKQCRMAEILEPPRALVDTVLDDEEQILHIHRKTQGFVILLG